MPDFNAKHFDRRHLLVEEERAPHETYSQAAKGRTSMPRIKQPKGTKGSLKWIQLVVNDHADLLNQKIVYEVGLSKSSRIEWRSPLRSDEFVEYRDNSFLMRLGTTRENRSLSSFWPEREPQWDALGGTAKGELFVVEAKAHIDELLSEGGVGPRRSRKP